MTEAEVQLIQRASECLREWVTQEGWTEASVAYQVDLSAEIADALNELLIRLWMDPIPPESGGFVTPVNILRKDEIMIPKPQNSSHQPTAPQDATRRNVQASNKRFADLESRYMMLSTLIVDVRKRLQVLEDRPPAQRVL